MEVETVFRFFGKSQAVIAYAEPHFSRIALELLNVALAGFGKAMKSSENSHGIRSVHAANIGTCKRSEDNLLHANSV
jgi:hypothetical protein